MRRQSWIWLVVVFVALAAGSYAATRLVQNTRQPQTPPAAPGFAVLQDYLQLTPDQRQALAAVDQRYAAVRPELRDRLWEARDNLLNVMGDPNSTSQQAVAAAKKFGAAQQAMQLNTIEYTYQMRKHLTPAQREKLVSTMGRGMCAMTCGPGSGRGMGGRGNGPCQGAGQGKGKGQGWRGGR